MAGFQSQPEPWGQGSLEDVVFGSPGTTVQGGILEA